MTNLLKVTKSESLTSLKVTDLFIALIPQDLRILAQNSLSLRKPN